MEGFNLSDFRDGDEGAFKWVYDRLGKALLYFVQNIIDSQPDAEDIVASAFSKLYTRGRGGMESYEHIKRWLYVIVRNEAIDYLRYKARSREVHQDLSYFGEKGEERVDLEMLRSSLLQNLHEAIAQLPRQRKAIVTLYFFQRMTTADIAQRLNISPQTVLNHKTRALESLRKTVMMPDWLASILVIALPIAFFLKF